MEYTVAITNHWQLHIPTAIREKLGLVKPGLASVAVRNKSIVITPQESSVLKLAGKFRTYVKNAPSNFKLEKVRDHIDYSQL